MAIVNEILAGRFNRGLQKLFGIKGGPPVAQLASEIMPNHPLFSGAENRYLEGWNLFGVVFTLNPGVGNVEEMQLRNPVGSGIIAVVHRINVATAVSDVFQLGIDNTGTLLDLAGGSGTVVPLDPRQELKASSCVNSFAAVASPGVILSVFAAYEFTINTNPQELLLDEGDEIPLLPGAVLRVTNVVTGSNVMRVNFRWRERFLEESERK